MRFHPKPKGASMFMDISEWICRLNSEVKISDIQPTVPPATRKDARKNGGSRKNSSPPPRKRTVAKPSAKRQAAPGSATDEDEFNPN
uniref:Uncharacterized protein n=1 Tax=Panagrolaimus superbus TaxID=310955 RepID=A0A914YNQ0_9BILA